ncbi:MAG: PEGA domain-containing protein, partial [Patescibacteria group bacterium]|nr:PEGA domain-containing protein [Patescibacteria group bacterium]
MSKQTRRIIFYLLVVLFLMIGITTILYAEGWRLALPKLKIERVGALYLNISPNDASVYINGEILVYQAYLFQSGILINDLLPGIYDLKISDPNYKDFSQAVSVTSSMVTKMENLILVPVIANNYVIATTTAQSSVQNFWSINNSDNFILKINGRLSLNGDKLKGDEVIGLTPDNQNVLTFDSRLNDYFLANMASSTQTVNLTLFLKNYFSNLDLP